MSRSLQVCPAGAGFAPRWRSFDPKVADCQTPRGISVVLSAWGVIAVAVVCAFGASYVIWRAASRSGLFALLAGVAQRSKAIRRPSDFENEQIFG